MTLCPLKEFFLWLSTLKVRTLSSDPWLALGKALTTRSQYGVRPQSLILGLTCQGTESRVLAH